MTNTRIQLAVYIIRDFDDYDDSILRFQSFIKLLNAQQWNHGIPQFFDQIDDESCTRPEDVPIRSVGCVLSFPNNVEREINIEQASYADVSLLVSLLEDYSRENAEEFDIELDGEYIGSIEDGEVDQSLTVGLLDAWRALI
jgi:hypothetical protein